MTQPLTFFAGEKVADEALRAADSTGNFFLGHAASGHQFVDGRLPFVHGSKISQKRLVGNRQSDGVLYHTGDMNLGNNIKARRQLLGLTQKQLAKAAGISQTTVADLERGRNTDSRHITSIAKALSITVENLVEGRVHEIGEPSGEGVSTPEDRNLPPPGLTDEQRRALAYLETMTPAQRAEWFRWADDRERENMEVIKHVAPRLVGVG